MTFGKEKIKKFIAMITVCVLLVGLLPTGVHAVGTEVKWGDNITETITGNVLTLSGSGPMYDFGENDGHRIKLMLYGGISTIVINEGITTIGNYAFEAVNITSVTIPNSVTSIGEYAFGSNGLTSLVMPSSVTSIGNAAFRFNQLTSLTVPDSVKSIGGNAFEGNKLTSVTMPSSVTSIGEYAFGSNELTSLVIPNSVTSIGNAAFQYNKLTSLTVPDSVKSIGGYAFQSNKLTSVTIPNSVESIGYAAFAGNQLTSLTIPDSIKIIDELVFATNQLTSVIIPNSVTSIGAGAFASNQLASVEIPNSVKSIDQNAFGYNQLTSLTIPNSVISIGHEAFQHNKLTSLTIPNSVTSIGQRAFLSNNLTQITIPANVSIDDRLLVQDFYNIELYNNFKIAYTAGGAGTYTGTQTGTWSKVLLTDTTRYDELVNSVNNLTEGNYTTQSVANYNTAIALVNLTLTNANTQGEIDAEVIKIQNALALLVLRPLEPAPKPNFSIEPLDPPQAGKILLTVPTVADSTIYYKQVDEFKSRGLGESFSPDGWIVYTAPTIVSADNDILFEVVIVDKMGKVLQSGGFELYDGTVIAIDFSIEIPQKILVGNTINFGVNVTPKTGSYNGFDFKSSNTDVATLLWDGTPGLRITAIAPGTVNFTLTATDAGKFERVFSVEVVDRSGLRDAINYIAGIRTQESMYTPETFGVLHNLDWYINQAYYNNPNLSFAEYEELLVRFSNAKNGLVLINVADTQAVAAAKTAIVGGSVNVAFGADQTAKTAAVQTYVNTFLTGDAADVTATVTYVSGNNYTVAISKGGANDTKTITMTINLGADPDITRVVSNAKTAAQDVAYADMTQGTATGASEIKAVLRATAEAAIDNSGVTVTINQISYTEPTAGISANPDGTDGSYVFTVTVSKGGVTQTTTQKTITITATKYDGLSAAKTSAKADIANAFGSYTEGNYSALNWTALTTAKTDGDAAIDAATDLAGVTTAKNSALAAMAAIKTLADDAAVAVAEARKSAETANYTNINEGIASNQEAIKEAIKKVAEEAIRSNMEVVVTVNDISFTPASGLTNGRYVFTITIKVGEESQTTNQITATIIPTYEVSGDVKDSANNNASDVLVTLMRGQTQIGAPVNTNAQGAFTIIGVPNGTYNLVVSKGDIIVTTLITVSGGDYLAGTITLPNGKTNSIVEVKTADTPPIVVGGLDTQFTAAEAAEANKGITAADKTLVAGGGKVEIKFTAEKKAENSAPNANNIKTAASNNGKTVGIFIDLSVTKTVTPPAGGGESTSTPLAELKNLIEVLIPLDEALQNKNGYFVYRYHNTGVDTITTVANADGEKIELIDNGKTIKLSVKKFSTYAIAFTLPVEPPPAVTPPTNNDKNAPSNNVTIKNTNGGTIKESPNSRDTEKIFNITPSDGYVIADVLVDGKSIGAKKEYTLKDLTKKVEIQALFVKASAIPYYVDKAGKEIFIKYSTVIDGVMKYIAPQGVTVLFKDNTIYFNDINGHFGMEEIDFVAARGLFIGTAPNVFSPDIPMTRSMFVTVIGKLHEVSFGEIPQSTDNSFADIAHDSWYAKYVKWAQEYGIISGVGSGKFEPDRAITREEMAVVIDNYLKFTKFATPVNQQYITFEDEENIGEWAKASVQLMQKLGIMEGVGNYAFNPKGIATRAQAAAIIYRMINIVLK